MGGTYLHTTMKPRQAHVIRYLLTPLAPVLRIRVLANGVGGVLRAPHSPRAAANCALAMALAALTTAAA